MCIYIKEKSCIEMVPHDVKKLEELSWFGRDNKGGESKEHFPPCHVNSILEIWCYICINISYTNTLYKTMSGRRSTPPRTPPTPVSTTPRRGSTATLTATTTSSGGEEAVNDFPTLISSKSSTKIIVYFSGGHFLQSSDLSGLWTRWERPRITTLRGQGRRPGTSATVSIYIIYIIWFIMI